MNGVDLSHPRIFVYVVPRAIVLAVPQGSRLVSSWVARTHLVSSIDSDGVGLCDLLLVCVPGDMGLDPSIGDREFREAVFGQTRGGVPVMKGLNELMLGELSERLRSSRYRTHWRDPRCLRTAITCGGLFPCHAGSQRCSHWPWRAGWCAMAVALAAVCACFSYYVLMWIGGQGATRSFACLVAGSRTRSSPSCGWR